MGHLHGVLMLAHEFALKTVTPHASRLHSSYIQVKAEDTRVILLLLCAALQNSATPSIHHFTMNQNQNNTIMPNPA